MTGFSATATISSILKVYGLLVFCTKAELFSLMSSILFLTLGSCLTIMQGGASETQFYFKVYQHQCNILMRYVYVGICFKKCKLCKKNKLRQLGGGHGYTAFIN